ncbi:prolipoprotein diacylglyceryl transferase [Klebsiella pneumoniae]|nr:prolipoprotein diacylglyceryl transferase [Klebsiella pneumoniae]
MSFHGGLIGVILVMIIFRPGRTKRTFFQASDFIAPLIPFGLWRRASGQLYQRRAVGPRRPELPLHDDFPALPC